MEEFNLNKAVAAYFEQHARNEKAIADLKAIQKAEYANQLKEEVERRLTEE